MSNEPDAVEAAAPLSERAELLEQLSQQMKMIRAQITTLRRLLLRLDEIGQPVSRSRTRATKLDEVFTDLAAHIDYDLIMNQGKQTKDQKVRAERYELS